MDGAIFRRPVREISCTVITLRKSLTLSPPLKRAAPAVGSTWFGPDP